MGLCHALPHFQPLKVVVVLIPKEKQGKVD